MIQLTRCAQAKAYLSNRDYVIPDDVKGLAVEALSHRMRLQQSFMITEEGMDAPAVIREIIERVEPPR